MAASNPNNAIVSPGDRRMTPVPASSGNARILVIDDEPLLGRTLRLAFQEEHEVVVVTSGREALDHLRRDTRYDLILCDLMMPDITGMAVYEHVVRDAPGLAEIFVFMTGGAFTEDARAFLDEHPGVHLEKPFNIARVEALVRAQLERRIRKGGA
jgi:CheY-like chemotaxis protein